MTSLIPILALAPLFNIGGSVVLSWLVTLAFIAVIVLFVVWLVTKMAGGPPNFPEWFKLAIWTVVILCLIVFIFAALGLHLP